MDFNGLNGMLTCQLQKRLANDMLNEPSAKTCATSKQQIGEYARIKHKVAHKQKRNLLCKATAKQEPDPTTHMHHLRAGGLSTKIYKPSNAEGYRT